MIFRFWLGDWELPLSARLLLLVGRAVLPSRQPFSSSRRCRHAGHRKLLHVAGHDGRRSCKSNHPKQQQQPPTLHLCRRHQLAGANRAKRPRSVTFGVTLLVSGAHWLAGRAGSHGLSCRVACSRCSPRWPLPTGRTLIRARATQRHPPALGFFRRRPASSRRRH